MINKEGVAKFRVIFYMLISVGLIVILTNFILGTEDNPIIPFFDGFEEGVLNSNWTTYGDTEWEITNTDCMNGAYCTITNVPFHQYSMLYVNISTEGYTHGIIVGYDRKLSSLGRFEYIQWFDGNSWTSLENDVTGSAWQHQSFNLPLTASNKSNFAIRFKCDDWYSSSSQWCRLDNINISETTDWVPPIITISSPENITYQDTIYFSLNITTDETATCSYSLNDKANVSLGSETGTEFSTIIRGTQWNNKVTVSCDDVFYNHASSTINFYVNATKPIAPFFDGFEEGILNSNWTTYGDTEWGISNTDCISGTYCDYSYVPWKQFSFLYTNISTAGHTNEVIVEYDRKLSNLGRFEYIQWFDGSSWTSLENDVTGSTWTHKLFNLPLTASNNSNFAIRFKCDGWYSTAPQWCRLDNINIFIKNYLPTHSNPIIETSFGTNFSTENITAYNVSTTDADGDSVKNIWNWNKDGKSLLIFNAPFEGSSTSGETTANGTFRDYSNITIRRDAINITWDANAGVDGTGAYITRGKGSTIEIDGFPNSAKEQMSFEVWFKSTCWGYGRIIHKDYWIGNGASAGAFSLTMNSNNFEMENYFGSGTWPSDWAKVSAVGSCTANQWNHVVGVIDNGVQKLYINGVLQATNNTQAGKNMFASGSGLLYLGSFNRWQGSYEYYPLPAGSIIDDVRIWNASLSDEQVLALYQNKANFIHSTMTEPAEAWSACLTPNDNHEDGETKCTQSITIL